MGREGYLTEVYRRYSMEDLASFYKKGESSLLVFTDGAETSKLRVEIEEKNKQLQTIINGLASENIELKGQVAKVSLEVAELKGQLLDKIGELRGQFLSIQKQLQELTQQ